MNSKALAKAGWDGWFQAYTEEQIGAACAKFQNRLQRAPIVVSSAAREVDFVTAIHEAGHAVSALSLGLTVLDIAILGDGRGQVRVEAEPSIDARIEYVLAGALAESQVTRSWTLDGTDRETVKRLCGKDFEQSQRYLDCLYAASRTVREEWPAICLLADELTRSRRLTTSAINQVLNGGT